MKYTQKSFVSRRHRIPSSVPFQERHRDGKRRERTSSSSRSSFRGVDWRKFTKNRVLSTKKISCSDFLFSTWLIEFFRSRTQKESYFIHCFISTRKKKKKSWIFDRKSKYTSVNDYTSKFPWSSLFLKVVNSLKIPLISFAWKQISIKTHRQSCTLEIRKIESGSSFGNNKIVGRQRCPKNPWFDVLSDDLWKNPWFVSSFFYRSKQWRCWNNTLSTK